MCGKSCRNGKSLYLCNRFREGEPLKMTDWKSWGYGRECRMLHRVSYLAMCKGARKGKPHAIWKPSEKFFQKKLSKKFGGYKKTPYLCKRFPAETGAWEKIVLWKTLDKQTKCSTSSSHVIYIMCIRDEVIKPSIWLNNQEIFGHLNRDKKYSQE